MELAPDNISRLLRGELLVYIHSKEHDVIEAVGSIFVRASAKIVWEMLTDYDHLHETMPKVASSALLENQGAIKIIEQTGRSGILIFERSVHFRLKVIETFPGRLHFEQLEGDFKVYEGDWFLEPAEDSLGTGTIVTYSARMKPNFFAPPILVSFVQSQDLPMILRAIRAYCEPKADG